MLSLNYVKPLCVAAVVVLVLMQAELHCVYFPWFSDIAGSQLKNLRYIFNIQNVLHLHKDKISVHIPTSTPKVHSLIIW